MQSALTIAGRQFRSYFNGPIAFIVLIFSLVLLGVFFFWWPNAFFIRGRVSVRELFSIIHYTNYLTIPALTMGLIADERASGTLETLLTLPVRDADVVLGKFLGTLGLYTIFLALTLPYPFAINTLGTLDWGPVFTGYLGLFFQGSALIGVGLMASSFTRTQLVALFAGWAIAIVFAAVDLFLPLVPAGLTTPLEFISFDYHLTDFRRGVIAIRDILFFLSVTAIALMVAFRSLESRRWK